MLRKTQPIFNAQGRFTKRAQRVKPRAMKKHVKALYPNQGMVHMCHARFQG